MMNNGIPLDVLKIVERLERGGVPHEQARVQATVLAEVIGDERKRVDARYLPREALAHELWPIKSSIEKLDAKVDRLDLKIEKTASDVKNEVLRWMFSLWFLQTGFLATVLITLFA
jgi:hypothetical protein